LRPRLAGEEMKLLAKRQTENAEAYQLYLQGLFYWNKWTQADFKKAVDSSPRQFRRIRTTLCPMPGLRIPTACWATPAPSSIGSLAQSKNRRDAGSRH